LTTCHPVVKYLKATQGWRVRLKETKFIKQLSQEKGVVFLLIGNNPEPSEGARGGTNGRART
jgi:hypothetical protein